MFRVVLHVETGVERTVIVVDLEGIVAGLDHDVPPDAFEDGLHPVVLVSGVNFSFAGNDAKFNVRGANSSNTFNDTSSIVGAYVDGVYKPRASQQTRAFFDVERVEFLKGPQ